MSLRSVDGGLNYSFTEHIRDALVLAREEAIRLCHDSLLPQHMLLGLLRLGEGVAYTALLDLGVASDNLRSALIESLPLGGPGHDADEAIPYAEDAKQALHFALAEAREFDSTYVGTEHLLLALVWEEMEGTAEALRAAGVSRRELEGEVVRIWEGEEPHG